MAVQVLDRLKEKGDLENTLVIITGDHGQEINDNKLNYWGHNSNFTNAQVKVPFAIFGPGVSSNGGNWSRDTLTSHQDVAPTVMKHYLGVSSDIHDYAAGEDLLGEEIKREWILSSNYSGYALITNDTILEVSGGGQYKFMDKTNRELKGSQPNFAHINEALEQISRFNQ
jgi:membrane-anchored protein YejM (alkaline phosphatase superfamily)